MPLRIWQFVSILLTALVAGVFWGPWLDFNRHRDDEREDQQRRSRQRLPMGGYSYRCKRLFR